MRRFSTLAAFCCLAVLLPAFGAANAQQAGTGSNVTITFPNNVVGSFANLQGLGGQQNAAPPSYRSGSSSMFSPIRMPGIAKTSNVNLYQGTFSDNQTFWLWHSAILMSTSERATVSINMTDANGNNVTWLLNNAWPTRIQGADASGSGGTVSVGALSIAFESATLQE